MRKLTWWPIPVGRPLFAPGARWPNTRPGVFAAQTCGDLIVRVETMGEGLVSVLDHSLSMLPKPVRAPSVSWKHSCLAALLIREVHS
jgi:hypothetical protein